MSSANVKWGLVSDFVCIGGMGCNFCGKQFSIGKEINNIAFEIAIMKVTLILSADLKNNLYKSPRPRVEPGFPCVESERVTTRTCSTWLGKTVCPLSPY